MDQKYFLRNLPDEETIFHFFSPFLIQFFKRSERIATGRKLLFSIKSI